MMKKKAVILILLVLGICIHITNAANVDSQKALKVARNFFLQQKPIQANHSNDLKLVQIYSAGNRESVNSSLASIPLFYVYNINDNEGFVIVAADDNASPILGYSLSAGFSQEKLPPACRELLVNYQKEIAAIKKNKFLINDDILKKWTRLNNGETELPEKNLASVSPLLTTTWDQGSYYNALCPYDSFYNTSTYTGCIATALAQIMKFWNYPDQGTGFHSFAHGVYGTLSANFGTTNYDWAAMPNNLTTTNDAVATLMYHCGVCVDMNYGTAVSTAFMYPIVYALTAYFQYSSTAQFVPRSNYSTAAWIQLLKDELNAGRPMQYCGNSGTSVGHSFVCDGYDNNDFFHFNWGWSGFDDGYFAITNMNPGSNTFNDNQYAIVGIKPANGSITSTPVLFSVDMTGQSVSADGVHLAGNFQGWDPASTIMMPSGNNIYSCTVNIMSATMAEYKFVNGTTWGQAETVPFTCCLPNTSNRYYTVPNASSVVETVPSSCALPLNGNRYFTVPWTPLVLPAVLFENCLPQPPEMINVTFKVSMANEQLSSDGIHLASDFQEWNPGASLMTNTTGVNYQLVVALQSGSYHEYKYINGNHWGVDESVPAACSHNNNRYITIPAVDTILSLILFGSCELTNSINEPTGEPGITLTLYPNPCLGKFTINSNSTISSAEIYNVFGERVYADYKFNQKTSKVVDLSNFPKGIYFVKVNNGTKIQRRKVVVQ